jgi:hypothetical protein
MITDDNFDLYFGKHIDNHCFSPVLKGDPFLFPSPLDFRDSHTSHSIIFKSLFNGFKPLRFYYRLNQFHQITSDPLAMLRNINSNVLFIRGYSQSHGPVNDASNDIGNNKGKDQGRQRRYSIDHELVCITFY